MSKGPGRQQRALLAVLNQHPLGAVHFHELAEHDTRSQRNSLWRAAMVLAKKGRIGMFSFWDASQWPGKYVYVLHRPGYSEHEHARRFRLKRHSVNGALSASKRSA